MPRSPLSGFKTMRSRTIFVPNTRYHRCDDCSQVFECGECTERMRQSQREQQKDKTNKHSHIAIYSQVHKARDVKFICADCKAKQRKHA